jgi:hypothetical protein
MTATSEGKQYRAIARLPYSELTPGSLMATEWPPLKIYTVRKWERPVTESEWMNGVLSEIFNRSVYQVEEA